MSAEDITPEGSAAPVFLDTTPPPPADPIEFIDRTSQLEAAAAELVALGMTTAAARAVVGLPVSPLPG